MWKRFVFSGGGGVGDSHMKGAGMLVVSLRILVKSMFLKRQRFQIDSKEAPP